MKNDSNNQIVVLSVRAGGRSNVAGLLKRASSRGCNRRDRTLTVTLALECAGVGGAVSVGEASLKAVLNFGAVLWLPVVRVTLALDTIHGGRSFFGLNEKGISIMVLVMSEAAMMGEFGFVATLPKTEERPKSAWEKWAEIKRVIDAEEGLVPVRLAVEMLGVSRQRVYELIEEGKVKTFDVVGQQFISFKSLSAWAHSERKAGKPFKPVTKRQLWRMAQDTAKEMVKS